MFLNYISILYQHYNIFTLSVPDDMIHAVSLCYDSVWKRGQRILDSPMWLHLHRASRPAPRTAQIWPPPAPAVSPAGAASGKSDITKGKRSEFDWLINLREWLDGWVIARQSKEGTEWLSNWLFDQGSDWSRERLTGWLPDWLKENMSD